MSAHSELAIDSEPDPVVRAYLADVDRTLVTKNLSLTPDERFRQLMALQRLTAELQRAGREARARPPLHMGRRG